MFTKRCTRVLSCKGLIFLAILIIAGVSQPSALGQCDATWNGGAGNWNTAANWTPAVVPNNAATNTCINAPGSTTALDISASIRNLTLATGNTLNFNNNTQLLVHGPAISNAGSLALNAAANQSVLRLNSAGGPALTSTLSGGGSVNMGNSVNNLIVGNFANERLVNLDNTIQGAGQIGQGNLAVTNRFLIDANLSAGMTIQPSGGGVLNTGTIRATGAQLTLLNGTFTNFEGANNGTIRANGAGSTVLVQNSTINGGNVDTVGTGTITLSSATIHNNSTLTSSSGGLIQTLAGTSSTLGGTLNNVAGGEVRLVNNSTLFLETGATHNNAGTITLNAAGGNVSDLRMNSGGATPGTVTLSGTGTVTMGNNANNRIFGNFANERLVNNSTIQGAGQIGVGFIALTNRALIDANQSVGLTIQPNNSISGAGGIGVVNTGTMRSNGGPLTFQSAVVNNFEGVNNGLIRANGTGNLVTVSNSTINGGNIDTVGTGTITLSTGTIHNNSTLTSSSGGLIQTAAATSSTIGGTLNNVAGGEVRVVNNSTLFLETGGTYNNAGTITLNAAGGNVSDLRLNSGGPAGQNVTLTGGGTVTMGNNANNRIFHNFANERLVNQDNTIQGAGQIGLGGIAITNRALIDANQSVGLTIQPNNSLGGAGGIGVVNSGTIRSNGGTLTFLNAAVNNFEGVNNGLIRANGLGNTVVVSSSTINGGNVDIVGAGQITLSTGTIHNNSTLSNSSTGLIFAANNTSNTIGGTLNNPAGGEVRVGNNTFLFLETGGTYNNAGTITLNAAGGNASDLILNSGSSTPATVTLSGGGSVNMGNNVNNRIRGNFGNESLVNVNNTIQGAGQIGFGAIALTNQAAGVINANQPTTGLTIQPNAGGLTNAGLIEATNGATLTLQSTTVRNGGGTILVDTTGGASTLVLSSTAVSGGAVTVSGPGVGTITLSNGTIEDAILTNTATGVIQTAAFTTNTLAGTLNNPAGGQVNMANGSILTLVGVGTYNNAGTIALNGAASTTDLRILGDVTLSGMGTVSLSDSANNLIRDPFFATGRLINADQTIQGGGQIGVGGMALTNQGVINANGTAGITIQPNAAGVINPGTLQAANGSTLRLQFGTFDNTGGMIQTMDAGSLVTLNGVRINGGTLDSSGAGTPGLIRNVTGSTATLDGVTLMGTYENANNAITNLVGTISNSGTLTLNAAGGGTSDLRLFSDVTLTGMGTVTLSNDPNNRIWDPSLSFFRLTNVDNTIQGSGGLGVSGNMALTNGATGTIIANQSNPLFINVNSRGFTNNGTLQVTEGSTLQITGPANSFTNFNFGSRTLTGGTYSVAGTAAAGTLRFDNADIVTNAATILLDGPMSRIIDQSGTPLNGLRNFAANAAAGNFTIQNGRNLTTPATFTNAGTMTIGAGSTFTTGDAGNYVQTAGTTAVNGALASGGGQVNINGGVLTGGGGTITGNVTVTTGGAINNHGTGTTPGTLNISGTYVQTSSGILFEGLGGTAPGTFDQTVISGAATLAGTLTVSLLGAFDPMIGDLFAIMTFASRTGVFGTINLPNLGPTKHLVVNFNPTNVTISTVAGAMSPSFDAITTAESLEGPVATPEPSTLLLLGSGIAGVLGYRRRKASAKLSR